MVRYDLAFGAPATGASPAAVCFISVCAPDFPVTHTIVPSRAATWSAAGSAGIVVSAAPATAHGASAARVTAAAASSWRFLMSKVTTAEPRAELRAVGSGDRNSPGFGSPHLRNGRFQRSRSSYATPVAVAYTR